MSIVSNIGGNPLNQTYNCFSPLSRSPQAMVRLTPATLLYAGKSPDGNHILVTDHSSIQSSDNIVWLVLIIIGLRHALSAGLMTALTLTLYLSVP